MNFKVLILGYVLFSGYTAGLARLLDTRRPDTPAAVAAASVAEPGWDVVENRELVISIFEWLRTQHFGEEYYRFFERVISNEDIGRVIAESQDLFVRPDYCDGREQPMCSFLHWFFGILNTAQDQPDFYMIKDLVPGCIEYFARMNQDGLVTLKNTLSANVYCVEVDPYGRYHFYVNTFMNSNSATVDDITNFAEVSAFYLAGNRRDEAPSKRYKIMYNSEMYRGPEVTLLEGLVRTAQETGEPACMQGYAGEHSFVCVTVNRLKIVKPSVVSAPAPYPLDHIVNSQDPLSTGAFDSLTNRLRRMAHNFADMLIASIDDLVREE